MGYETGVWGRQEIIEPVRAKRRRGRRGGRKPYGHYAHEREVLEVIAMKRRARKGSGGRPTGAYVIARELNEMGLESQTGGDWTGQAVAKILARLEKAAEPKRKKRVAKTQLAADDYLTESEVRKLLSVCRKPVERLIVQVLVGAGLRAEEFCSLQVRDLGLDGGKRQIDIRRGKGNKARSVFVSETLAEVLRRRRAQLPGRKSLVYGRGYWSLWDTVRRLGERAGISGLHPHVLRHTFGTILYNYKPDLLAVAEQMGHASTDTTKIYAKCLARGKLRQVEVFDGLLGSAAGGENSQETVSNIGNSA